ncbi:hybrid sensor histidine kinase/response regulator [Haloglomus halophilum]|uniref:hybrid sensor histidine kinase/response regulator n=1 Tax=Haloglomus halophilum TaxID=2962672 RepID=UPI0020C9E3B4|nr:PAS domain S-box protein [Haloglomus halophilum]
MAEHGGGPLATDGKTSEIRLLHIDDDAAFADIAKPHIERCNPSIDVTTETDPEQGLERLAEEPFDCVLCDYDMPGQTGLELLTELREFAPELPFILFTGKGSEEIASDAFSAGATDYFRKPTDTSEYEVLAERIATVVDKYRTEQRLERSEERYRRLVETAPVPIAVHHGDEIVFANRAAAEFLAVDDPEELVGDDPIQYLETDDRAVARERIGRLLDDETTTESIEEQYVDANGEVKQALVAGSAIEHGGKRAVQVVVQDVTEHRERQQELERYRQLVEAMGDGVYALDAEGRFEMFNERMVELSGYSREELQGMDASEVMTESGLDRTETAIRSLLDGEADSVTIEVQAKRASGAVVPRELTLTLQPTGPDESFAGTVGVVHDISERRARERELEQKNEQLEAFAEIVSHDLQNPLSVVSGHVALSRELADEGASGEDLLPQLEAISEATDRMTTMTEDLLTLAKQGDTVGDREPVVLSAVVRDVWETLDTTGATLAVEDPGTVEADPTRLEQLVANLLENAVEHGSTSPASQTRQDSVEHGSTSSRTESGDAGSGASEPSVADAPEDTVEHDTETAASATDGNATTDGGDDQLEVVVRGTETGFAVLDDGPGIPESERDDVFERGYSTETGTGFGLAIVRTVAEAHGWEVTVGESAAGGARFDIHIDA